MDESEIYGMDLKIILIGNVSTGKTSIVDRYIKNVFREEKKATISPNFSYKLIKKKESDISFAILGDAWSRS